MVIYGKWAYTDNVHYGIPVFEVDLEDGTSWYTLAPQLDDRSEKWVVGVDADGYVNWATEGTVVNQFVPRDGGLVVLTDFYPEDGRWYGLKFDGESFTRPLYYGAAEFYHKERLEATVNKLKELEFSEMLSGSSRLNTEPTDFALWLNYLHDLKSLDLSDIKDEDWPVEPKE